MAELRLPSGDICFVDDDDLPLVSGRKWRRAKSGNTLYAQSNGSPQMHRLIMGAKPGQRVDHIDGNGLNNRRSNLRFANHAENAWNSRCRRNNSTGLKGVAFHKTDKAWYAQIRVYGKKIWLGYHKTAENAHNAYKEAARKYFGEFARFA